MPSNAQTGTQTATISTRHQLGTTVSTAGNYVLRVDTGNLANGDALTLEVESKLLSGGTRRVSQRIYLANAQANPVKDLYPEPEVIETAFFLTQTAGTGRAFDWAIVSL